MTSRARTSAGLAFVALLLGAFGAGVYAGHRDAPPSQPHVITADEAVTLLAGQVRKSDGMSYAEWHARRLQRVAHVTVTGYLPVPILCPPHGAWAVQAQVTPWASADQRTFIYTRTELGVVSSDGSVLDVPQEPAWVRLGERCAPASTAKPPPSVGSGSWLDDFRSGAAP